MPKARRKYVWRILRWPSRPIGSWRSTGNGVVHVAVHEPIGLLGQLIRLPKARRQYVWRILRWPSRPIGSWTATCTTPFPVERRDRPSLVERSIQTGVGAYLRKPIDERELDAAIRLAAARHAELEALEAEINRAQ